MHKPKIVIATRNILKFQEIVHILQKADCDFVFAGAFPELPEVIEDGHTLYENTVKKARETAMFLNKPSIADDTGLFVRALNFKPGVNTARYAGAECDDRKNMKKLLHNLTDKTDRYAYFTTVMALYCPRHGLIATCEGKVEGYIIEKSRGHYGFGYDPIFVPLGQSFTYAEMPSEKKNKVSHRFLAVEGLKDSLIKFLKEKK